MPGWNCVPRWRTMMLPASIGLAAVDLHAEVFRVGVAAVAREPTPFLCAMTAVSLLLVATGDAGDFDFGVVLPMAHLLAMVLAAAELDDADLVGAAVALTLAVTLAPLSASPSLMPSPSPSISTWSNVTPCPTSTSSFSTRRRLALHHAVLLTAGYDDCVHDQTSSVVIFGRLPRRRGRTEAEL